MSPFPACVRWNSPHSGREDLNSEPKQSNGKRMRFRNRLRLSRSTTAATEIATVETQRPLSRRTNLVSDFIVKPLDKTTWSDFAQLVEKHNGIWGGCWCMAFHGEGIAHTKSPSQNRSAKEHLVREGRAHAALVYDGSIAVGWCQYGPSGELPSIKHKRY